MNIVSLSLVLLIAILVSLKAGLFCLLHWGSFGRSWGAVLLGGVLACGLSAAVLLVAPEPLFAVLRGVSRAVDVPGLVSGASDIFAAILLGGLLGAVGDTVALLLLGSSRSWRTSGVALFANGVLSGLLVVLVLLLTQI